jgi:hypothetical protein
MKIARQGDVLLRKVDKDKGMIFREFTKSIVLAEGEKTGHAHVLECDLDIEIYEKSGKTYVGVLADAMLRHEEHDSVAVEPGIYEVITQREYTPERIQRVLD